MMPPRAKPTKAPTSRQSITHQLRALIEASGLTPYEIGRRAGLESGIIRRFLKWERGLTLDSIDQLADALGFRLAETARGKAKASTRSRGRSTAVAEEGAVNAPVGPPDDAPPGALPSEPDESPPSVASEPPEEAQSAPAFEVSSDQPASWQALAGPVAESPEDTEPVSETASPWWEQLPWHSGPRAEA